MSKLETPPKGKLTRAEYDEMIRVRPVKASKASQVGYREATGDEDCLGCIHWFTSPAAGRSACEIFRPPEEDIKPDWVCDFWTNDGKAFPLLP